MSRPGESFLSRDEVLSLWLRDAWRTNTGAQLNNLLHTDAQLRQQLTDATQRAEKAKQDAEFNLCCTAQAISERDAARDRVAELEQDVTHLIKEKDAFETEAAKALLRVADLERQLADLQSKFDFNREKAGEMHADLIDTTKERDQLRARLRGIAQRLRAISSGVNAGSLDAEDYLSRLEVQLAKQDEGERRYIIEALWGDRWVEPEWENDGERIEYPTKEDALKNMHPTGNPPLRLVEQIRRVLSGAGSEGER